MHLLHDIPCLSLRLLHCKGRDCPAIDPATASQPRGDGSAVENPRPSCIRHVLVRCLHSPLSREQHELRSPTFGVTGATSSRHTSGRCRLFACCPSSSAASGSLSDRMGLRSIDEFSAFTFGMSGFPLECCVPGVRAEHAARLWAFAGFVHRSDSCPEACRSGSAASDVRRTEICPPGKVSSVAVGGS